MSEDLCLQEPIMSFSLRKREIERDFPRVILSVVLPGKGDRRISVGKNKGIT